MFAWSEKAIKPLLVIYISCLFFATFFMIPTVTSFYYYAWGKHLAWSYFDGPPMIAYFFSVSHAIFGNTFFSINCVGFFCLIVGAYYIYKLGCLLQNQQTGLISALIWMALPTTTESVFIRVLYDAPLNLFTIIAFYYFVRYLSLKRVIDMYLSAFFIGAMILSKYTAVISIISMLFYIIFSKERHLFKRVHFYLACLLIILMVTPVIYWNVNHHWISISYLLNFHSQAYNKITITQCLLELTFGLFINYSIFLLLSAFGWFKYRRTKNLLPNSVLECTYIVLFVGLVLWFLVALMGGDVRVIYLTPLGMNIALITGYCMTHFHYRRFFTIFYSGFLFFSIVTIVANAWPVGTYLKKGRVYAVIENALLHPKLLMKEQPIVTGYYTSAALLNFFMPNETIYAIPCRDINQYQYWNEAFLNDLSRGKINKITYVDFRDTKHCAERFFNTCQSVATLSHYKMIPLVHKLTKPTYLYVYECSIPRIKDVA